MEKKVLKVMSDYFWNEELKRRSDPKNAFQVKIEQDFFKELNAVGEFGFYWKMQFQSSPFKEKDKDVIPIFIKYLDRFEIEWKAYYIYSLGVKGFYGASEYLINEYINNMPPKYNSDMLNSISQTLAKIQDPRFIDKYISFLNYDVIVTETAFIVELLGNIRAEEAIPYILGLLDRENSILEKYFGTGMEDTKYFVSQYAIVALSKFGNPEHVKYIEKFLKPEKLSWIKFSVEAQKDYKHIYKSTYATYKKIAIKAIQKMKGK